MSKQQLNFATARAIHWISNEVIFFAQAIIRMAYGWRGWAERRSHIYETSDSDAIAR